jgi:hypothetical protein
VNRLTIVALRVRGCPADWLAPGYQWTAYPTTAGQLLAIGRTEHRMPCAKSRRGWQLSYPADRVDTLALLSQGLQTLMPEKKHFAKRNSTSPLLLDFGGGEESNFPPILIFPWGQPGYQVCRSALGKRADLCL